MSVSGWLAPHVERKTSQHACHTVVVTGLVLLGAFLRMFRLTDQSIWYDEAFDVLFAQRSLTVILDQAVNDTMPPLHYILLHAWMRMGSGELIAKLFPVFLGVLATAAMYPLGRRLLGPKVGLGGVLLLAVSPFQIFYAREVRMYSQLLLFGLLSTLFFVRCLSRRNRGVRSRMADWVGLIVFTTLTVYTHTLGFLIPLAIGVPTLIRGWRSRAFVARLLLSGLVVTLLALPWILWVLPAQAGRIVQTFWVSRPSALAPLATLQMFLVGYAIPALWLPVALFVTLSLGAIALYQAIRTRRWVLVLLLVWLAGPILLVWLISSFAPIYLDRLFIAAAPAFYLLLAWSFERMPRGLSYVLGGLLAAVILVSLGHYYLSAEYHKPPMRDAALYVADRALSEDVVLHTGDSSFLTFCFYEPRLEQYLASGDPDHQPGSARSKSLELLGYAAVAPVRVMAVHRRVWLVVALDHSIEFQNQVVEQAIRERTVAESVDVGGILVYLLDR